MSTPPPVWTDALRVRSYEVGPEGHVALQTLCDYLQEAAGNHATALGVATDRLLAEGRAWVLARLQVEIDRYPAWREALTIETWPSAADGLYAQRDFLLRDESGSTFGRATSTWFIIDVQRRRPIRLPATVLQLPIPDRPHPLPPDRSALPEPDATPHGRRFTVRRSDLDLNDHVNNVRYVEWALEAVPETVRTGRQPRRLDVQFRAESVYGDTIVSACSEPEETAAGLRLRHRVTREGDDRLLALLETVWR